MEKLYLIATIAGQRVAIRAAHVESVVEVGAISPVPLAPAHVSGLAALRSKVLTVICCERALGLESGFCEGARMVVVSFDGHHYGLLVGSVEDARVIDAPPTPVRAKLEAGWARVAIGMLDLDGAALLLVDPERIVGGEEALAA